MNVVRCKKCKYNPRITAKDLLKMLDETGTKVSLSAVKQVLHRQPERPLSKEEATAQNRL
jgi:uncharacterized protein YneF (UPF0154 family)